MALFQNYNEVTTNPVFRVFFRDNRDISISTIVTGAVTVTGPGGFNETPTFVPGSATAVNGTDARADFRLDGITFNVADNGLYTVNMIGNVVEDSAGNTIDAAIIGTFDVLIYSTTLVPKHEFTTDTDAPFPLVARDSSSYDNIDFYESRTARNAFDGVTVIETGDPPDFRGHVYTSFAGEVAGSWLSLSFGREVEISQLTLKAPTTATGFNANRYYQEFRIQVSTDEVFDPDNGWTDVYTRINEPTWNVNDSRDYSFPPAYAKHVRIVADANHGGNFIDVTFAQFWGAYTLS